MRMGNTDTTSIRDVAYKEIEEKLSKSSATTKYKTFMSNFMVNPVRQQVLFSSLPAQIYYSTDDINKWFAATGVDKKIITEAIKGTYFYSIANFNPRYAKDESTIALCCMVRYYLLQKNEAMLNLALLNLVFSGKMWSSIFHGYFKFTPQQHIMEYVVNTMMNSRFDLIRYGTILASLKSAANSWVDAYKDDRFKDFTDYDVQYLVQQIHTRVNLFLQNIAELYYKAHENKDAIMTFDSDDVSEDNFRTVDNDSFKLNRIVDAAIDEITTKYVDKQSIKRASNNLVSYEELNAIFESLVSNKENIPLIKEFITLMVSLYFTSLSAGKEKDVNDISFISFSIRPTPNTKDKYQLRKKELMEIMLLNSSDAFARRRNRAATESAYFKAFNAYLALVIKKANEKK